MLLFGNVHEAPDAPAIIANLQRAGEAHEQTPILELQNVARFFIALVQTLHLFGEPSGFGELVQDKFKQQIVAAALRYFFRDAPHLLETPVGSQHPTGLVNHQDTFHGGAKDAVQEYFPITQGELGHFARIDVHAGAGCPQSLTIGAALDHLAARMYPYPPSWFLPDPVFKIKIRSAGGTRGEEVLRKDFALLKMDGGDPGLHVMCRIFSGNPKIGQIGILIIQAAGGKIEFPEQHLCRFNRGAKPTFGAPDTGFKETSLGLCEHVQRGMDEP